MKVPYAVNVQNIFSFEFLILSSYVLLAVALKGQINMNFFQPSYLLIFSVLTKGYNFRIIFTIQNFIT
jgi:hypothetical protein